MSVLPRASVLATEVQWLNSIKADLVVLELFLFWIFIYEVGFSEMWNKESKWDHIFFFWVVSIQIFSWSFHHYEWPSVMLTFLQSRFQMLSLLHAEQLQMLEFVLFASPTSGNLLALLFVWLKLLIWSYKFFYLYDLCCKNKIQDLHRRCL